MAVDAIVQQLEILNEGSQRPQVAIVALPVQLLERVWNAKVDSKARSEKEDSGGSDAPDFRGMLKAKAMSLSFPIQIAWEDVFDESARIPRKVKENRSRKITAIDEAGAELRDLVWVQESYSVKVLRDGNYPVMRGTFVELDGKGLSTPMAAFPITAPIRAFMTRGHCFCAHTRATTARLPSSRRKCWR